ncbi:Zn-dependent peptidase ImmA (M78 family) [Bradyrhizobium sp. USDA 4472]
MADYASSIRKATLEAGRLHRDLAVQASVVRGAGRVDVFSSISRLDVPLLFTKLDGLLGVYLREPSPGILITTQRPRNQQRFTAAHELGHHYLGHEPSLDDEDMLRRTPFQARKGDDLQEVEAEAFAAAYLLPRWLVDYHCERQDWNDQDLTDPINVYQLALRVGTSYEATVWTLHRYEVFDRKKASALAGMQVRKIKQKILRGYEPENYRGDVWLLTDRDADMRIEGGPQDLLVVRLPEHSGSGYLWRVQTIDGEALAVVADGREPLDADGVGGPTLRQITAAARDRKSGELRLAEMRPWQPTKPLNVFKISYSLEGAEAQGWFKDQRQQHRQRLEAA